MAVLARTFLTRTGLCRTLLTWILVTRTLLTQAGVAITGLSRPGPTGGGLAATQLARARLIRGGLADAGLAGARLTGGGLAAAGLARGGPIRGGLAAAGLTGGGPAGGRLTFTRVTGGVLIGTAGLVAGPSLRDARGGWVGVTGRRVAFPIHQSLQPRSECITREKFSPPIVPGRPPTRPVVHRTAGRAAVLILCVTPRLQFAPKPARWRTGGANRPGPRRAAEGSIEAAG